MDDPPLLEHDYPREIAEALMSGTTLLVGDLSEQEDVLMATGKHLDTDTSPRIITASMSMLAEDLIGRSVPIIDQPGTSRFAVGPLTEAMRDGRALFILDIQLLGGSAREAVRAVLRGEPFAPAIGGHVTTIVRPGFVLGATAPDMGFELADDFATVLTIA